MKLEYFRDERLREAIRIYLDIAYEGATVPKRISELAEHASCNRGGQLVDNPNFEVERGSGVLRIFLRLGNRFYPHMKLGIVECAGLKGEFVLIADTHDKAFAAISDAPDFGDFKQLQRKNEGIKNAIETAWATGGFLTETGMLQTQAMNAKVRSRAQATIMIVDDTPITLMVEAIILDHAGFQVVKCPSGFTAVEQAQNTHIDLCLMDIMMPGMDGYEAIRKIRKSWKKNFPILIATAMPARDVKKKMAEGFISKPFTPRLLVKRIDAMLKKSLNRRSMIIDPDKGTKSGDPGNAVAKS